MYNEDNNNINNQQQTATPIQTAQPIQIEEDEDGIQWKNVIGIILYRKFWIMGVMFCFLVLAILYLQKTSKVYSRYTTILVQDDKNGRSAMSGVASEFSDLGMLSTKSNVDNEVEAFKSPYLMYMVVKKLKLDVSYQERNFLNKKDLYVTSPISASFMQAKDEDAFAFKVDILAPNRLKLYAFRYTDKNDEPVKDNETEIETAPFANVMTPVGQVMIGLSDDFDAKKDIDRTIIVSKQSANDVADANCKNLDVELTSKKTSVVNITYNDLSIKKAEDVLNALLEIYNNDRLEEKRQTAASTSKFIDGRLLIIEQELGGIDNDIEQYKSSQLLTNVQVEGTQQVMQSNEYSTKTLDMNNQLAIAQFLKERLDEPEDKPTMLPSNSGLTDGGITNMINEYNEMVLKRDRLVANSSDRNPLVVELNNSLKGMRVSIEKSIDNIIKTNNMRLESLRKKEGQIQGKLAQNPKQEKYLLSIGRQQKIKESLYLYLLQKREENELSGNMQVSNIRMLTPPRGPKKPVSPKKVQIVLIALVLGFILPTAFFWMLDALNTTVRGKKDLENLSLPLLGEIPLCGKINDNSKEPMPVQVVVEDKKRDFANEAFRVLRTNFSFMTTSPVTKTIMYTSFYPNSGKTFVATNLALSLALTDKKCILVDLDLRKGEMSNHLAKRRHGVSTYLSGQSENVKDCIVNTKLHKNLDILPCGVIPPNPAELLLSERLTNMLTELSAEYDYVFVDCTPMHMVADASIVGKLVDMVFFVIREGKFEREALPEVDKLYTSGTFKRMATILNGTGAGYTGSTYGHYGHYGSYGHYGHYGSYGSYGSHTKTESESGSDSESETY